MIGNSNMAAAEVSDVKNQDDSSHAGRDELDIENKLKPDEFCFECKKSLNKSPELINVTGQPCRRWHPECFRCMVCKEPMGERQSCHVHKDQVVCRADYMRLKRDHSIRCNRCNWPIGASDWVRKAANYVYHLACFNCDICFRQLNTGEQFVIDSQPADALSYSISESSSETVRLMCKLHFTIDNQRIQNTDKHEAEAHSHFTGPANNMDSSPSKPSETDDSHKHSAMKSQEKRRQQEHAVPDDGFHLVSRAASTSAAMVSRHSPTSMSRTSNQVQQNSQMASKHYQRLLTHANMFSKDHSSMLSPSTSSSLIDDSFTSQHQQGLSSSSTTSSATSSSSSSSVANLVCISGPVSPTGCSGSKDGFGGVGSGGNSNGGGALSKSKRVRTTFTEDQLSILQTHFQIDSNPDGQDLERIATITGLSKRVTQVWFQNSRARQKKYMIKRKPPASMASNLAHEHHLHQNQHFNRHQHTSHAGLVLVNQAIIGRNDLNSPSPGLENIHQTHSNEQSQLVNQDMNLKNFSHKLLEISFSSPAESEQKRIRNKVIDDANHDSEKSDRIDIREQANLNSRSDDDEKSGSSTSSTED